MENEQKQFVCTGNCMGCSVSQRAFCASQHSYMAMRMLQGMASKYEDLERRFIALTEKVEAVINNDATIFDPNEEVKTIAQEGDGAEE